MVLEANGTVRLGDSAIVVSDELHPPKQDREDPQDDLPPVQDTTTSQEEEEEEDKASSSSSTSSTHTVPTHPVSLQVQGSMTVEPRSSQDDKDDRTLLTVQNEDGTCTFDSVRGYWLSIDVPPSQQQANSRGGGEGGPGRRRLLEEDGTPPFQDQQHYRLDVVQAQARKVQDQQTQLETAIRTQQQQPQPHYGDMEERLEALERLVAQYQQTSQQQ